MSTPVKTRDGFVPSGSPVSLMPGANILSSRDRRKRNQEKREGYIFDLCPILLGIKDIKEISNIRAFKFEHDYEGDHNVGVASFVMPFDTSKREDLDLPVEVRKWMQLWRKNLQPQEHYQVDFFEELMQIDGDLFRSRCHIKIRNIIMTILVAVVLELHHHGEKVVEQYGERTEPYAALHKLFQKYEKLFIKPLMDSSHKDFQELNKIQGNGVIMALERDKYRCMISQEWGTNTVEHETLLEAHRKGLNDKDPGPGADLRFVCFCHESMTNPETFRVLQYTLDESLIPTATPEALKELIYSEYNIIIVDEKFVCPFNEHKISLEAAIRETEEGKCRKCYILSNYNERMDRDLTDTFVEFKDEDPRKHLDQSSSSGPPSRPSHPLLPDRQSPGRKSPSQELHSDRPGYESPSGVFMQFHRAIYNLCRTGIMNRSRPQPEHVIPAREFGGRNVNIIPRAEPHPTHPNTTGEHEAQAQGFPHGDHAPSEPKSSPSSSTNSSRRPRTAESASTAPAPRSPMTPSTPAYSISPESKRHGGGH